VKPIDGIVLADLIKREADEHLAQRTEEVLKQIRGIVSNRRSWSFMVEQKTKEIEELMGKIKAADAKLDQMSKGDWSPLKDAAPKGEAA
jgi:siroheme synthase (precorrin-2 oxidase/ferrochelatase)